MKNKLVVVTDLGSLKAYRLDRNELNRTPRLELLQDVAWAAAHEKLADKLSDRAGRFANGGASGASSGERHNIALEHRKRLVKQLAERVSVLIRPEDVDACYFAASKEINHLILQELDPRARAKIEKNVPADLTKLDKGELLNRFVAAQ